jgi:hypothetical protein
LVCKSKHEKDLGSGGIIEDLFEAPALRGWQYRLPHDLLLETIYDFRVGGGGTGRAAKKVNGEEPTFASAYFSWIDQNIIFSKIKIMIDSFSDNMIR